MLPRLACQPSPFTLRSFSRTLLLFSLSSCSPTGILHSSSSSSGSSNAEEEEGAQEELSFRESSPLLPKLRKGTEETAVTLEQLLESTRPVQDFLGCTSGSPTPTAQVYFTEKAQRMSWTCHGQNNCDMVDRLHHNDIIKSTRIAEAMKKVDRGDFVLDRSSAYLDSPQPIGFSATISAPHMHGYCLALLEGHLQPGNKVLDVGSGSGYLTAVMALMVGPTGRVVGVEHIPELVERSIAAVQQGPAASLLESGQLSIHEADGRQGYAQEAPFDAIHVGAAAPELPQALLDQLKPGGRLVIPVGTWMQDLEVVDKGQDGAIHRTSAMGVRYVPLTEKGKQVAGV